MYLSSDEKKLKLSRTVTGLGQRADYTTFGSHCPFIPVNITPYFITQGVYFCLNEGCFLHTLISSSAVTLKSISGIVISFRFAWYGLFSSSVEILCPGEVIGDGRCSSGDLTFGSWKYLLDWTTKKTMNEWNSTVTDYSITFIYSSLVTYFISIFLQVHAYNLASC